MLEAWWCYCHDLGLLCSIRYVAFLKIVTSNKYEFE